MDDYGIHDAYIEYNILSPEYFSTNNSIEIWELLKDSDRGKKDISIVKSLDISDLNLSMGDEIHFWFIAKDQNNLTKSHKFIGKFPTCPTTFLSCSKIHPLVHFFFPSFKIGFFNHKLFQRLKLIIFNWFLLKSFLMLI